MWFFLIIEKNKIVYFDQKFWMDASCSSRSLFSYYELFAVIRSVRSTSLFHRADGIWMGFCTICRQLSAKSRWLKYNILWGLVFIPEHIARKIVVPFFYVPVSWSYTIQFIFQFFFPSPLFWDNIFHRITSPRHPFFIFLSKSGM